VKNKDTKYLPYMPAYNYQIMIFFDRLNEKNLVLTGNCQKITGNNLSVKNWILIQPLDGYTFSDCDIKFR